MTKQPAGRQSSRARLNSLVSALREDILTGVRAEGEYLPSEKAFADQYQLSNQSVRKGLEVLQQEGLIAKIPRVGSKVLGRPQISQEAVKLGFHTSITSEGQLEELLARFRQQHPAIRVQPVPMPYSSFAHVKQYLTGGILDAVMMNYNDYQDFAETGHLELLEPLRRNPEVYPFLSDAFAADGTQRVQPFIFSPLVLCYNRRHFTDRQLSEPDSSWTWEDLIRQAEQLALPGERLGFHCDLLSPNRWPLLPLQQGIRAERRPDGTLSLAGSQLMDGLRTCREIKRRLPHLSEIATGQSEHLLAKGKVSMILTSYFYLNYLMHEQVPFDLAPVPHFGTPTTLLLNTGLAVNRISPVKEAAIRLVDFLTSYETQLTIRRTTYSLPAHKLAAEWQGEETMYRPSRFSLFRETIPGFRYFTDLGLRASELAMINREVKLFWAGLEQEEPFCTRLEAQLQSMALS